MKIGIVPMRMQPFHKGHEQLIMRAVESCDKVLILVGSPHAARSFESPLLGHERKQIVENYVYAEKDCDRNFMHVEYISDVKYTTNDDALWALSVDRKLDDILGYFRDKSEEILEIWCGDKDASFYSKHFNNVVSIDSPLINSGTQIRRDIFISGKKEEEIPYISDHALPILKKLRREGVLQILFEERLSAVNDKILWDSSPYDHVNMAADMCLFGGSGSDATVLLIKRGGSIGKNQWALPGGYINYNETVLDCCLREGNEEAGISMANAEPIAAHMFDAVDRSLGTRTITTAFAFHAVHNTLLTISGPGDDANGMAIVRVNDILNHKHQGLYSDHWHIIKRMFELVSRNK